MSQELPKAVLLDLDDTILVFDALAEEAWRVVCGRFADRLLLLDDGKVVAQGEPAEILDPGVLNPVYRVAVTVVTHGKHRIVFPDRLPDSRARD